MIKQHNALLVADHRQPGAKGRLVKATRRAVRLSALAVLAFVLAGNLRAAPTVIRIDASHEGSPKTEVLNSENYNTYVGPDVNNAAVEYGALVDLLGVDNVYTFPNWTGQIPDQGWRFTDPKAPDQTHSAVYIIWIDHDYGDNIHGYYGPLFSGDLRVGFNARKPGTGYYPTPGPNPPPGADVNAGPVQSDWVTLYSDTTLVLQFKGFKAKKGQ